MFETKLLKDNIQPRKYQLAIAETAAKRNTLVVLPTGIGKTLIAFLVALNRLEKYPEGKILITAPTRPLNAQHKKSFEDLSEVEKDRIVLVTGKIIPEERKRIYKTARVIIATPQTIRNDIKNDILSLENFSLVVFDEAHRSVKEYAYTFIAKEYKNQSKFPLILALTASPGGTEGKIMEIRRNLFIEDVEIRSETDEDVVEYVQPIKREGVYVEFPEEFKRIKSLLQDLLREDVFWLRDHNFIQTLKPTKKLLLVLQRKIWSMYVKGNKSYPLIWAMMKSAEAIKIEHALELLETQGISQLYDYFIKIHRSKKKTDKMMVNDNRIKDSIKLVSDLYNKKMEHPKITKLIEIIKGIIENKKDAKIIVFANFRSTVNKINEVLSENGIASQILIGQSTKERKGMSQDEQIEILRKFGKNEFNVLIGTSISEEGLDVPAVDYAIFYEAVPSEIRAIQRRGRVGRHVAGKTIFLITKDTRDEAYYWSSLHKEKKMRSILHEMKEKIEKKTLKDWV